MQVQSAARRCFVLKSYIRGLCAGANVTPCQYGGKAVIITIIMGAGAAPPPTAPPGGGQWAGTAPAGKQRSELVGMLGILQSQSAGGGRVQGSALALLGGALAAVLDGAVGALQGAGVGVHLGGEREGSGGEGVGVGGGGC